MHSTRRGFTLVELLVVVTIIVVLLALLMPALSKAIYAARLAGCGANQKLTAGAAILYTFSNKQYYPQRPAVSTTAGGGGVSAWAVHLPASSVPTGYDMRPILREKLSLDPNAAFQCPLIQPIDLDARPADEFVYGNTALWFSWGYFTRGANGGTAWTRMDKLGDAFEYNGKFYNLLVSDIDLLRNAPWGAQAAHPDPHEGRMFNRLVVRVDVGAGLPHTASFWQAQDGKRGKVDYNYGYDDGSVRLVRGIVVRDMPTQYRHETMDSLPSQMFAPAAPHAGLDVTLVPP